MQQEIKVKKELMISSVYMNALLDLLRVILCREPSITEVGKLLTLIGSFKDETEQEGKGEQE